MKGYTNKLILLIIVAFTLLKQSTYSQYTSKENSKGNWESSSTWNPVWGNPQTWVNNTNISINGYVTAERSLVFGGTSGNLIIKDTLVVKGDLTLGNYNDLLITNSGVLIVWGNLSIVRHASIASNGYLIVVKDLIKTGQYDDGSLTSNQYPAKVFIGGNVPSELTNGNDKYPALDCTMPNTNAYLNSSCSYGNLADLANTPIFDFYQSSCSLSKPTVSVSGSLSFCSGNSVTLTSSPGVSYLWSNGTTTSSVIVNSTGTYSVRVTDNNRCLSSPSNEVAVTVTPVPPKPTISYSGDPDLCAGETLTLTSDAAFGYVWESGETTQSINVTNSGTYKVKVFGEKGCVSEYSESVQVNLKPLPATPEINTSGPLTFCQGDSVELISSSAYSYLWSNGAISKSIKVKESGSYSVTVVNEHGCKSTASAVIQVNVLPLPEKPSITSSGALNFCLGDSVKLTSGLGKAYWWSNGMNTKEITIKNSGAFKVRVTDENGCRSLFSDTVKVIAYSLPEKPSIKASGSLEICSGDTIILESGEAAAYRWSTGEASKTIRVFLPGEYFVKVTDINGCESSFSDTLQVRVNSLPAKPEITASGSLDFCRGENVILFSGDATEYVWSTGESTPQITVTKSGIYSVRVKNTEGCLSEPSEELSVTVNPLPSVSINSDNAICSNSIAEISGTPAGGIFNVLSGHATIENNKLIATSAGNVIVEYTYTNLCSSSVTKSIVINELPEVFAGPDQEVAFSYETEMQAELLPSEKGEWTLISGKGQIEDLYSPTTLITGLGEGENVFQWKVIKDNCVASADVVINVVELFIPSVITPNGDGENDYFYINPANGKLKLIIFNKWGNLEYSADNYMNNWDGRNNKGIELPNDTYFYVLHFENGTVKKGSLLIKK